MANLDRIRATVALIEEDEATYEGKHFDMSSWVQPPEEPDVPAFCNTTMCFAGWAAVHKVGGIEKFLQLAVRLLGEDDPEYQEWETTSWAEDIEGLATEYLEISPWEARQIFYATNRVYNVETLKQRITDVLEHVIWEEVFPQPFQPIYQ